MNIKKTLAGSAGIFALALSILSATSTFACGGDENCGPELRYHEEMGASFRGSGEFETGGSGGNGTSDVSKIINRKSLSESDGFLDIYLRSALDDCANCVGNSQGVKIEGEVFQRNYSAIEAGKDAHSGVRGSVSIGAGASADRWKIKN